MLGAPTTFHGGQRKKRVENRSANFRYETKTDAETFVIFDERKTKRTNFIKGTVSAVPNFRAILNLPSTHNRFLLSEACVYDVHE